VTAADRYLTTVGDALAALREQAETIERTATLVADSLRDDGVLHVAGCGHSQLAALELAARAGGLAAVQAIADPALGPAAGQTGGRLERLHGYAAAILEGSDCRPGEVLVVVSHSGINPVPVELALEGRQRGLRVVGVTSVAHANAVPSRHADGRKLHEVAEVVLDTGAPQGDAAVALDGARVGPVSTTLAIVLLHAVTARAAELLLAREEPAPVLVSHNLSIGPEVNAALVSRYRHRARWMR
jgi:uncharacterized phosphosugar-binding protein